MKVRFLKSPTGRYGLAYSAGEIGDCPAHFIEQALKEGYVELLPENVHVGGFMPEIKESINIKAQTAQKAVRRGRKNKS